MARYQAEIEIAAPPDVVFAYLSDLTLHSDWAANDLRIEPLTQGESGVGARFRSRGRQLGRDVVDELTIVALDWPWRFAFEARGREGRFLHSFEVRPADAGSQVTKGFGTLGASFPSNLLAPLFAPIAKRNLAKDLRRIKQRLEK